MSMYSTKLEIDGKEKTLVVVNHKDEEENSKIAESEQLPLHHIHVLDRSYSMNYNINNLIDNVQETLNNIGDDDIISIIWFSSPGEYRTLIKGANKSQNISHLLDTIRSVIGSTCFSDPVKEVGLIIDELYTLCPNISVTLFTDGCPVVPWSNEEEESRLFSEIEKIRTKILAFNTIGYGNYYNRDLLVKIASSSEFGTMVHSSNISDYLSIFKINLDKVGDNVTENIDIEAPGCDIIYLNRKFTKMESDCFSLSSTDKRKNQFFIIGEGDIDFKYQGKSHNSKDLNELKNSSSLVNLLYSYSFNTYYKGKKLQSLSVLGELKDKSLIDSHFSSFTYDECAIHLDKLKKCIFSTSGRFVDGECDDNYLPKEDALCVMDVLNTLAEEKCFYLPFSDKVDKYTRISKKSEDDFSLFKIKENDLYAPFRDFVYNKKKINLSIRFNIPGVVKINPKSAKYVDLPNEIESSIFRTHTIIKDGNLNMKKLEIMIPENKLSDVLKEGILSEEFDKKEINGITYVNVVIDFSNLPIINRMYINQSSNIDVIFDSVLKTTNLETMQKLVKYYIDKVFEKTNIAKKEDEFKVYNLEQIRVLEEHGLSEKLVYNGVSKKVKSNDESDSYVSRVMEFYFKGCSSIPKVDELFSRLESGKKLTFALSIMKEQYSILGKEVDSKKCSLEVLNIPLKNILEVILENVQTELIKERTILNSLKMAKILTGDWFDDLTPNDKGEYLVEKYDSTMIAKVNRETVYF